MVLVDEDDCDILSVWSGFGEYELCLWEIKEEMYDDTSNIIWVFVESSLVKQLSF